MAMCTECCLMAKIWLIQNLKLIYSIIYSDIRSAFCNLICDLNCTIYPLPTGIRLMLNNTIFKILFSWTSTAPNLTKKKKHIAKKVNYRKHVDVSNKTIIHQLSKFKFVTSWELPPFKVHHVR